MTTSTETLYDDASQDWKRSQPLLLSDFTARPFLLDWCEPVSERAVLDLGCGEGYFARKLAQRGAGRIEGMDLSSEMIARAQEQDAEQPLGIRYSVGDAPELGRFESASFDLVVAVFLFNYLSREATAAAMAEIFRVLRPGGCFVFAVPHPSLPFLRAEEPPFYFVRDGAGYFSGRNRSFEGRIDRLDGVSVPVRCIHKTLADYFGSLSAAGFCTMPEVEELGVTKEILDVDPEWFRPLEDQPLHLAFRVEKN